MNSNSNQNKCFDITMHEENDIDEYIQDNNNIVFIDKINKKAFCSNREDLKKFYLDSIVFPCTKTFANLFIVGDDNRHAATGEKIIETIPYVKLKNLAIGYDGVITLESFYNLVIDSSQNKYNIEKPNKNEQQSLVATIDRNLVKKYMKIGTTPDAVSNAHCQVGTNVNILKIVDPSKPDYKDKEKENFSIPTTKEEIEIIKERLANVQREIAAQAEQEIRARTVVRSPTANERRNVRTITSNRRANRNNNNNTWHPYPNLRDIGHSNANTYQEYPELTSQQIAFANNFFGQNGQPNNNNNNFVSQPQEDLFSIQNTPVQNSNSSNIPNAPVRDRLTPILNSVNQRNNNSNQPVRRSLFSQIPAAQQSVLTQSSTNNNSNNNTPNSPILGRRRRNNSNNNTSNTNNISTPSIGRTQTPENRNSRTRRVRPRTMGHGGKKKMSKRKFTKKRITKRKISKKRVTKRKNIKKRVTKKKT
jgi:hypothetical protein